MERPEEANETPTGDAVTDSSTALSDPAPPDADVCGPTVACRLDERDRRRAGDSPPVLTLQPWTPRGAGATYVAWTVDDCGGHFGVFDRRRNLLFLGEGTPAGRRWRPVVDTGPASGFLSRSTPELRPSVPRATATAVDGPVLRPSPADAAATGETRALSLDSWTRPVEAYVQPWRPLNGGAVYLACRIDDPHERFSYHGWFCTLDDGVLRLGRRPTPAFVAVDLDDETAEAFAVDVDGIAPTRTQTRVVDRVLSVRDRRR